MRLKNIVENPYVRVDEELRYNISEDDKKPIPEQTTKDAQYEEMAIEK